jgi:SPX domain protein involved in polyphosphate accumulation
MTAKATNQYVSQAQLADFVAQFNAQFERVINLIEKRFDEVNERLDRIDNRLDELELDMRLMKHNSIRWD